MIAPPETISAMRRVSRSRGENPSRRSVRVLAALHARISARRGRIQRYDMALRFDLDGVQGKSRSCWFPKVAPWNLLLHSDWRNQAAAGDLCQALPKPVKSLPEHMPRLTWASAHKNVRVISDGTVLDAVWNRKVAGKLAGLEYSLEVGVQKTRRDNGFRRRVAVSAQPVRVRATDHFRHAVAAAIKVDRCGFTGIASEDAYGGIIRWERIANAKHRIGHFAPT